MPIGSGGGGGGTFNGGTITQPLVIDCGNNNVVPLTIRLSLSGQNVNMLAVHSTDGGGADIVFVDSSGDLNVQTPAGVGSKLGETQVAVTDGTGTLVTIGPRASQTFLANGTKAFLPLLPGADPGVSGQLYVSAGAVKVSP